MKHTTMPNRCVMSFDALPNAILTPKKKPTTKPAQKQKAKNRCPPPESPSEVSEEEYEPTPAPRGHPLHK